MESKIGSSYLCERSFHQSDFDRFATLSGDDNPIHVDPDFSRRTKFGRTVAHGMLLYASISSCMNACFPDTYQTAHEMIFPNPTYTGELVKLHLTATGINETQAITSVSTQIIRGDGEITCQALTHLSHLPYKSIVDSIEISSLPSEAEVWKGLTLGDITETRRVFHSQDIDDYCDLVQEDSLLYKGRIYANRYGFKDTPIPEALLGGMISYLLGTKLPGRGTNWLKQKLYFIEPVYPQEEAVASVEVVRLRPEKDLVNLRTLICNAVGAPVCRGEALVLVKDLEI